MAVDIEKIFDQIIGLVIGPKGDTGKGISSIEKTGTTDLIDTYTITFTDGSTAEFTVTNGAKGERGETGPAGEVVHGNLTEAFDATAAYAVGDYVWYSGQLYKFTAAHAAGAWDETEVEAAALADDVSHLNRQLSDKQDKPATAGTAGQVLSLDDQLNPVWADQTGGSSEDVAPVIINTASGDIASFADGADNRQIRKIVGTIVTPEGGSGWTGAVLKHSAHVAYDLSQLEFTKNHRLLRDGTMTTGASYKATLDFYDCEYLAGMHIYSNMTLTTSANDYPIFCFYSEANEEAFVDSFSRTSSSYVTFTVPTTAKYMRVMQLANVDLSSKYIVFGATAPKGDVGSIVDLPISWTDTGAILNGTITLNSDGSADVTSTETGVTTHIQNVGTVMTYLGENHIWIDTGSITEVNYPSDTKLYIDGITAPDEDMISNAAIASGKYFVVNNQLYLSTAAIAKGAQIIPGTNCTATNLAEALNAINA